MLTVTAVRTKIQRSQTFQNVLESLRDIKLLFVIIIIIISSSSSSSSRGPPRVDLRASAFSVVHKRLPKCNS